MTMIQKRQLPKRTRALWDCGSYSRIRALNLHESGLEVVVGLRESSSFRVAARDEGSAVATPAEIVSVLVPVTVQPAVCDRIGD